MNSIPLAGAEAEMNHPYFARVWTAEDGLPENRVVGVAQTSDGYLWVATRGGLVRFDGVQFQPFEAVSTVGFITSTMWGEYLDRQGRLWVAKELGSLVCIDGTNVLALTSKDGLPQFGGQCSMAEDSEGSLWISYSLGVVVYVKNGVVKHLTDKSGLPAGGVCLFTSDRHGRLWFAKNGNVGLLRNGRFVTLLRLSSHLIQIAPARSGGIWICAGQKVMKFNEGAKPTTLAELPNTRATAEPTALLEDNEGAVWVGTPNGLFRCDSNGVESVETSSPIIFCLAEDREGNLWVGTKGGGLDRLECCVVSLIGERSGLPFEEVRSLCQDASGAIWAVGENGVLARRQAGQWTTPEFDTNMPDPHSTCVTANTHGTVWIGTDLGVLYQWKDGQFQRFSLPGGNHCVVRSLLVATSGDLWVATYTHNTSNVLYRIHDDTIHAFPLPPGYRIVRAMTEDAAGNIWAGASDGLLMRVTGNTLVDETARFPKFSIRCLYGASNGDLWIGYAGFGVGRLHEGKMTRFGASQGLPNDYVSQILSDGKGGMWFAGNRGIFQVPEQDFDGVEIGRVSQLHPIFYGRSQGLPNLQASFDFCPNAIRDGDGRLFFSMLTGLAEVRTDRTPLNRLPPDVIIERVTADNQIFAAYQTAALQPGTSTPLELDTPDKKKEITLPPGLQHIQIEFTALSFISPENVRFRYQLEGIDRNWVDAGTQRVAQYTHLPP
ncbi:MAG: ligand-binding sensor domain-containing protein, partial [Limisphaerales bacterium]